MKNKVLPGQRPGRIRPQRVKIASPFVFGTMLSLLAAIGVGEADNILYLTPMPFWGYFLMIAGIMTGCLLYANRKRKS